MYIDYLWHEFESLAERSRFERHQRILGQRKREQHGGTNANKGLPVFNLLIITVRRNFYFYGCLSESCVEVTWVVIGMS